MSLDHKGFTCPSVGCVSGGAWGCVAVGRSALHCAHCVRVHRPYRGLVYDFFSARSWRAAAAACIAMSKTSAFASSVSVGSVSYTHLTLPTIYSV